MDPFRDAPKNKIHDKVHKNGLKYGPVVVKRKNIVLFSFI